MVLCPVECWYSVPISITIFTLINTEVDEGWIPILEEEPRESSQQPLDKMVADQKHIQYVQQLKEIFNKKYEWSLDVHPYHCTDERTPGNAPPNQVLQSGQDSSPAETQKDYIPLGYLSGCTNCT